MKPTEDSTFDRLPRLVMRPVTLGQPQRSIDRLDLAVYSAGLAGPCLNMAIARLGPTNMRAVAQLLPGHRR